MGEQPESDTACAPTATISDDLTAICDTEASDLPTPSEAVTHVAEPRPSRLHVAAGIGLVALVGFFVPLAITRHYGAFGIVRNDDWSYLLTLFRWVDHGKLSFNNWVSMTLIGQLVLAAPVVALFGHHIAAIQLETAFMGFVGLVCVMWIAFTTTRKVWVATFVAAVVAAGPLWAALAFSYMTDVPAFAVSMLACALGVRAVNRERVSMPYAVASLAFVFVAFTIRQYAAVPGIALACIVALMLRHEGDRRRMKIFVGVLIGIGIAALLFLALWSSIPNPKAFTPEVPNGHSIRAVLYKGTGMLRLLGLLVTPAILLAGPVRIIRRSVRISRESTVLAAVVLGAPMVYTAHASPRLGFAGNYVSPDGILAQGVVRGHRPDIFPPGIFSALLAIGTLSALILAIALVPLGHELAERFRDRDLVPRDPVVAFLGLTVAGYGLAYFVAGITNIPLYDRYILPVVPLAAILLLRPRRHRSGLRVRGSARGTRVGTALVAAALLAVVGLVFASDSAAFDGARWHVAQQAVAKGWAPRQIRGGFEWTNYYGGTRVGRRARYCVRVTLDPKSHITGPRVVAVDYYRSPLTHPVRVVAIRTRTACVPKQANQTTP
jgi:hypothetical protein